MARLRSVELARRAIGTRDHGLGREGGADDFEVSLGIFQSLTRANDAKGSRLVLLWLPVKSEIYGGSSRWRSWVTRAAAESVDNSGGERNSRSAAPPISWTS